MPLYTRHCGTCPTLFVVLSKMDERNDPVPCESCGADTYREVELTAYTPSGWGDSRWSGRFDKGLGITLQSKAHRDQVMAERGLVEDTVPDQLNRLDAVVSQASEHEATMARFQSELVKADGERGLAIANTFPSQ